jgi:hypothetical protein
MRAFPSIAAWALAAAFLAGCAGGSDGGDPPAVDERDFDDLGLEASETTGLLRGVVVDDAIRPIANASVRIAGPTPRDTTTNADGLFGFSGLEPGTYFVHASKPGYNATQASADVVAGVADPPIVRILLSVNPSTAPYVQTYVFEGFIECSGSFVAFGLAACSALGLPNDKFLAEYEVDRPPQWVQSEVVWESTQAVSPGLNVVYSYQGEDVLYTNYVEARGPSPLVLQANETVAASAGDGLGNGTSLIIRVFNEPIEGTRPSDPVGGDGCVDRPVLGGCATGVGVTVEQSFSIITNVFYGVVPDPSWRYTEQGPYPIPA